MFLLQNLRHDFKSVTLAILLHAAIFASLFSVSSVAVDISNYSAAGSFTMMSFSNQNDGITEKKVVEKREEKSVSKSQNSVQNSQNNNNASDSSSEIVYDAKNLGNPQPQYPLLSKRKGEEGTVLIRAFVDASGAASKVEIFKSSSFSLLDSAALEAIKKWHFVPAKRLGQYISSSVIIPINFKLTQNS